MNRSCASAVVILLVACVISDAHAQTPPGGPPRPVATGRMIRAYTPPIPLNKFVARVQPVAGEGEGECREYELPLPDQYRRMIRYTVGTGPVRRKAELQIDENGRRLQYIETRGDLQLISTEPATTVSLDFVGEKAQATNEADGKMVVAEGTLAEALEAENLGRPRELLELLEKVCLHK